MSVIMAYGSRNAYRPNELCLHTMTFCDAHSEAYGYEYFRYTAWQMMTILKDMVETEKFQKDDKTYADKLRQVADELTRAAHLIENPHADEIKFYHEDNQVQTSNHNEATKMSAMVEQMANLKNLNFKDNSLASNVKIIKRAIQPDDEEQMLQR